MPLYQIIITKQEKPTNDYCNVQNWTICSPLKNPAFGLFLLNCFLHCLGAYTVFGFTSVRLYNNSYIVLNELHMPGTSNI